MPEVAAARGAARLDHGERREEGAMKIGSIYRPEVISTDEWDSLADAASRMQFYEVGSLVVFDQRQFVGIITERDLVRAMADGAHAERMPICRYMTESPVVIGPDTDADEAIRTMLELGVRHLPVVDGKQVVGMVSVRDLLAEEHDLVVSGAGGGGRRDRRTTRGGMRR
jgi:CBS domain-containing protein